MVANEDGRISSQWSRSSRFQSTANAISLPDKTRHTTSIAALPTAPYVAISSANPTSAIFLVQNNAPPSGPVSADFDKIKQRPNSFVSNSASDSKRWSVAEAQKSNQMTVPGQPSMKLVQTIALPHPVYHLSFAGSPAGVPGYLTSTTADPLGYPMCAEPRQLLASSNEGKILVLKVTPPTTGQTSRPQMEWLRSISGFSSESFYPHAPKPGRMTLTDRVWASEFLATGSPMDFFPSSATTSTNNWRNFCSIQGGKVGVWDVERGMGRVSQVSGDTLWTLAPHPVHPHMICTAGASNHMYYVDLRTSSLALYSPQALSNFAGNLGQDLTSTNISQAITTIGWSPFLPWTIAAGGEGGSVGIWDIRYCKRPSGFSQGGARGALGIHGHVPLESLAPCARTTSAFSHDSTSLAGCHNDSVTSLKWSLVDPNWFVTSSLDKTVRTWKLSAESTPLSSGLVSTLSRGFSRGTLDRESVQPTFALVPTDRGRVNHPSLDFPTDPETEPPAEDVLWWSKVRPMRRPDQSPSQARKSLSRPKRNNSKGSIMPDTSMSIITPSGTGVLPLTVQQTGQTTLSSISGFVDMVQSPSHPGLFYAVTATGEVIAQEALNAAAWEDVVGEALEKLEDDAKESKKMATIALWTRNLAPAYKWVERLAREEVDHRTLVETSHSLQPEPPFAPESWNIGSKGMWEEDALQEAERACVSSMAFQVLEYEGRLPPGYGWSQGLTGETTSQEQKKRQWLDSVYLGNVTPQLRSMLSQITLKTDVVKMSQRNRFDQVKTMGGTVLKNVEAWIRGEQVQSSQASEASSSNNQASWDAESLSHVVAAGILDSAHKQDHGQVDVSHRLAVQLLDVIHSTPNGIIMLPPHQLIPLVHILLYPTYSDTDIFAPDPYLEPELPELGGLGGASNTLTWKLHAIKEFVDQSNGLTGVFGSNEHDQARMSLQNRSNLEMLKKEMILMSCIQKAIANNDEQVDEEICKIMEAHLPSTPSLVAQNQSSTPTHTLSVFTSRLHLDSLLATSRYPEYWRLATDVVKHYPTSDFSLHLVHQMDRHALPMLKAFVDDLYTASSEELAEAVAEAASLSRDDLGEKLSDAVGFLRDAVMVIVKISSVISGIAQDVSSPASSHASLTPSMSVSHHVDMQSSVATGFFAYLENVLIDLLSTTGNSLAKVLETMGKTCPPQENQTNYHQQAMDEVKIGLQEACIRGNIPLNVPGQEFSHRLASQVSQILQKTCI